VPQKLANERVIHFQIDPCLLWWPFLLFRQSARNRFDIQTLLFRNLWFNFKHVVYLITINFKSRNFDLHFFPQDLFLPQNLTLHICSCSRKNSRCLCHLADLVSWSFHSVGFASSSLPISEDADVLSINSGLNKNLNFFKQTCLSRFWKENFVKMVGFYSVSRTIQFKANKVVQLRNLDNRAQICRLGSDKNSHVSFVLQHLLLLRLDDMLQRLHVLFLFSELLLQLLDLLLLSLSFLLNGH